MPELPEVEVIRRGLRPRIVGARLSGVRVRETRLRRPVRAGALEALVGRRIQGVDRRGKYLIVGLDGGKGLLIHLGMSGQLLILSEEEEADRHDHLLLSLHGESAGEFELRFRDPRRFGLVAPVELERLDRHPALAHLGPEPFDAEFSSDYLLDASRGSKRAVKNALMDARVVAGVGNIYANEALWMARVHPRTPAGGIGRRRWERLRRALRRVLRAAIVGGGTSFSDFRDAAGRPGRFQVRLRVYDREGRPCRRCGGPVRRILQAGRATFYCPRCQR